MLGGAIGDRPPLFGFPSVSGGRVRPLSLSSCASFPAVAVEAAVTACSITSALLLERNPKLTPADVRRILQASARRLGAGERDDNFGSGLIDPLKALQLADPRTAATMPAVRQRDTREPSTVRPALESATAWASCARALRRRS